jgi:hypothetical protein
VPTFFSPVHRTCPAQRVIGPSSYGGCVNGTESDTRLRVFPVSRLQPLTDPPAKADAPRSPVNRAETVHRSSVTRHKWRVYYRFAATPGKPGSRLVRRSNHFETVSFAEPLPSFEGRPSRCFGRNPVSTRGLRPITSFSGRQPALSFARFACVRPVRLGATRTRRTKLSHPKTGRLAPSLTPPPAGRYLDTSGGDHAPTRCPAVRAVLRRPVPP